MSVYLPLITFNQLVETFTELLNTVRKIGGLVRCRNSCFDLYNSPYICCQVHIIYAICVALTVQVLLNHRNIVKTIVNVEVYKLCMRGLLMCSKNEQVTAQVNIFLFRWYMR